MIRGQSVADVVPVCMSIELFCFRIALGCVEQIDESIRDSEYYRQYVFRFLTFPPAN
jgi:hypothetical protein